MRRERQMRQGRFFSLEILTRTTSSCDGADFGSRALRAVPHCCSNWYKLMCEGWFWTNTSAYSAYGICKTLGVPSALRAGRSNATPPLSSRGVLDEGPPGLPLQSVKPAVASLSARISIRRLLDAELGWHRGTSDKIIFRSWERSWI